jgi:hypothetical protein
VAVEVEFIGLLDKLNLLEQNVAKVAEVSVECLTRALDPLRTGQRLLQILVVEAGPLASTALQVELVALELLLFATQSGLQSKE